MTTSIFGARTLSVGALVAIIPIQAMRMRHQSSLRIPYQSFWRHSCFDSSSRDFSEIDAIYGQLTSPVWSGGIIYQYFSRDFGNELTWEHGMHLTLSWR